MSPSRFAIPNSSTLIAIQPDGEKVAVVKCAEPAADASVSGASAASADSTAPTASTASSAASRPAPRDAALAARLRQQARAEAAETHAARVDPQMPASTKANIIGLSVAAAAGAASAALLGKYAFQDDGQTAIKEVAASAAFVVGGLAVGVGVRAAHSTWSWVATQRPPRTLVQAIELRLLQEERQQHQRLNVLTQFKQHVDTISNQAEQDRQIGAAAFEQANSNLAAYAQSHPHYVEAIRKEADLARTQIKAALDYLDSHDPRATSAFKSRYRSMVKIIDSDHTLPQASYPHEAPFLQMPSVLQVLRKTLLTAVQHTEMAECLAAKTTYHIERTHNDIEQEHTSAAVIRRRQIGLDVIVSQLRTTLTPFATINTLLDEGLDQESRSESESESGSGSKSRSEFDAGQDEGSASGYVVIDMPASRRSSAEADRVAEIEMSEIAAHRRGNIESQ